MCGAADMMCGAAKMMDVVADMMAQWVRPPYMEKNKLIFVKLCVHFVSMCHVSRSQKWTQTDTKVTFHHPP